MLNIFGMFYDRPKFVYKWYTSRKRRKKRLAALLSGRRRKSEEEEEVKQGEGRWCRRRRTESAIQNPQNSEWRPVYLQRGSASIYHWRAETVCFGSARSGRRTKEEEEEDDDGSGGEKGIIANYKSLLWSTNCGDIVQREFERENQRACRNYAQLSRFTDRRDYYPILYAER